MSSLVAGAAATAVAALRGAPGGGAGSGDSTDINVVEKFGFRGDGRADNTAAFLRWAEHVNSARGGHYVFPPGRYSVHHFRGSRGSQGLAHATIQNCDGLTISGAGAQIVLNGAFHRSARAGSDGRPYGLDMGTFIPFLMRGCRNVQISGFDIDGGVRSMSRDREIPETVAYLIVLRGCTDVLLEDLDLHHCQTDALMLYEDGLERGGPGQACRNIILNRVRCRNNARGAFAPIQVNGLICTDCEFGGSNYGLGKYLGHSPGFGVDVEPDYFRSNEIDIRTGNLEFRRCRFDGNASAFLAAYPLHYTGFLRLIDCSSSNSENGPHHMIINWPGAVVQGGTHDAGDGTIFTSWQGGRGGELAIRDCEIRSSGLYGVLHDVGDNLLRMENVKLIGTQRDPGTHGFLLSIRADPGGGRQNLIRGCDIFLPRARKSPEHIYDYEITFHNTISVSNQFRTDLPNTHGQHFCTEYGPRSEAQGDRYRGTAPGPTDSFRPSRMASTDTRRPFSRR